MRKQFVTCSCLALATCLALVGCSGSQQPANLTVQAQDFAFSPPSVEVKAGQTVNFTFNNGGTLEHEWVLFKAGESVSMPFDDDDEEKIFWEVEAEPGESKTETFSAPGEAGTYEVLCGIPGHAEAGMKGTLTVK